MPAPAWLVATPIAHRGLHDETCPENSLRAIEKAVEQGFPVEIDVQVTSDGRAVVFHDWSLLRLTGLDARVRLTTASKIATLCLAGSVERIPLLEDVLDAIGGHQAVIIEIKNRKRPCAFERKYPEFYANIRGMWPFIPSILFRWDGFAAIILKSAEDRFPALLTQTTWLVGRSSSSQTTV